MTRITFLHGREGSLTGSKAQWFCRRHETSVPALDTTAFDRALVQARHAVTATPNDLLVGSSFGGALALTLAAEGTWTGPIVLLAPALHLAPAYCRRIVIGQRVVIVHGRLDEIVLIEGSRALARGGAAKLIEVAAGHRLEEILTDGTLELAIKLALA